MDVSVVVATYGDDLWRRWAASVAVPSAEAQTVKPREIIQTHGATLHEARNVGAVEADGEWLCFLDADDELDPGYIEAMERATIVNVVDHGAVPDGRDCSASVQAAIAASETDVLLAPAVLWLRDGCPSRPQVLSDRNIAVLNPCVIGTLVRRETFLAVGGFWDWPAWEDWCLFRRCHLAGAAIVHVAGAVYRAHVREEGRNSAHAGDRELARRITASHKRWQRERLAA